MTFLQDIVDMWSYYMSVFQLDPQRCDQEISAKVYTYLP